MATSQLLSCEIITDIEKFGRFTGPEVSQRNRSTITEAELWLRTCRFG